MTGLLITDVETLTTVTFRCGHEDVILGYGESHDVNIAIALEVADDEDCCSECQANDAGDGTMTLTTRQVASILEAPDSDAALYVWHGQVFLDTGNRCQLLQNGPAILCSLSKRHKIAPLNPNDASVWVWEQ
jgi:hypothetical protein